MHKRLFVCVHPLQVFINHKIFLAIHLFFRQTKFYWNTVPSIVVFLITCVVSIYVIKVAKKLSSSVAPTVAFQSRPVPTVSRRIQSKRQGQEDIEVEDIENGEAPVVVNENIQRQNDNPHMFYRVKIVTRQPSPCIIPPPALALLKTAKICVKVNVISLISIGLMIPENIISTYVFITGANCDTDIQFFLNTRILLFYVFVCTCIYPFMICKKLSHFVPSNNVQ